MGACCASPAQEKMNPRGAFELDVDFGIDLVSPQGAKDIHTHGTMTETRSTGLPPNEIKEVELNTPVENMANIVEVSSGPLSEIDKHNCEDSANRKQMEWKMETEVLTDTELTAVTSPRDSRMSIKARRNSEPFLNQPLLYVQGEHVWRLT